MDRKDLPLRIKEWKENLAKLEKIRAEMKKLKAENFKLESEDGLFWSKLKLLAGEIAEEHAKELCRERNWSLSPPDVIVAAVPEDKITEKSMVIIYHLLVAHLVVISYHFATNAIILENLEENVI